MKLEIVLSKDEVSRVFRDSVDECPIVVTKQGENFLVETEPTSMNMIDLGVVVADYAEVPHPYEVESAALLPDGGIGVVLKVNKE